jgi:NitT/TauT family transport system substrate-binding protein
VSSALATQDQNNGTSDITAGNSVSYIQDQVSGRSNLEIVAEGSLMQPNNQALYTLPGSPLKSITELGHARIGVNATNNIGTLLISSVLEEHGVSLRDVQFVPIKTGFPDMALALQQHLIDVAWLPEPFGSADSMKFGLQEVADLNQGATTNFPVGWYVVTKAWAKKYPRTLEAFLAALQQAGSRRHVRVPHAEPAVPRQHDAQLTHKHQGGCMRPRKAAGPPRHGTLRRLTIGNCQSKNQKL